MTRRVGYSVEMSREAHDRRVNREYWAIDRAREQAIKAGNYLQEEYTPAQNWWTYCRAFDVRLDAALKTLCSGDP